ncbi:MAG: CHAT domain-containing protein, partial [Bryobacteraceae bacterium]
AEVIDAARLNRDPAVLWEAQAHRARLLTSIPGREAGAEAAFRDALATIDVEWTRLGGDEHRIGFLSPLMRFHTDYVDFLVARNQSERAAQFIDESRARVLARKLDRPTPARPAPGAVVLSYWLGTTKSYLWIRGARGFAQAILPPRSVIEDLVNRYSREILDTGDPLDRDSAAGRELYRALVAPAEAHIPLGARVLIIPDGSLHALNFETLLVDGPPLHYWIEDAAVAVAPSMRVLDPAPPLPAHDRALFIGDPAFADPRFPPLPALKEEAGIVRRHFPRGDSYTREQAIPAAYRQASSGAHSVVHFAAHATANVESPLDSAVILSRSGDQYKLYARDVMGFPLAARVVTISACYSAGSKAFRGEGLMGFAWAFLQAGARNVVAGIWEADDGFAPRLMDRFYHRLAAG